jgi:hypothetical protein
VITLEKSILYSAPTAFASNSTAHPARSIKKYPPKPTGKAPISKDSTVAEARPDPSTLTAAPSLAPS